MTLTKRYLTLLFVLLGLLVALFVLLSSSRGLYGQALEERKSFVRMNSLPGLAVVNEAGYLRQFSLAGVFDIYSFGAEIRDVVPASYVYKAAPYINNNRKPE